jgi:hypothetical protein
MRLQPSQRTGAARSNFALPWQAWLLLFLVADISGVPVAAKPAQCVRTYNVAEKASARALLRATRGHAYDSFDLDHPVMMLLAGSPDVVETPRGKLKVDRRGLTWLGFLRAGPATAGVPPMIVVAFEKCGDRAIGFQDLEDERNPTR